MKSLKLMIIVVWVISLGALILFQEARTSSGQTTSQPKSSGEIGAEPDIEAFNEAVQKRFLTQPSFGMRRMLPIEPEPLESDHIRYFAPVNDNERAMLSAFEKDGFDVGLYLYGRQTMPERPDKEPLKKFNVRYRINKPLPITSGLEIDDLVGSKKLIDEVKTAFDAFQTSTGEDRDRFKFTKGDWTYVAKPVRAAESCLQCHTDYVVLETLKNKRLKVRKRAVGDVNGVIVYAFSKKRGK